MIPKTIHYCWFGGKPLPKSAKKCIASWRKFMPDHEIKEWNESNFNVNMIPYMAEAYTAKKYAFVSDYARFWVLYHEGGLYFDTDVEVIRSFENVLSQGAFMGMESQSTLNPGLGLASEAGHLFYKWYLDYFADKHFNKEQLSMCPVVSTKMEQSGWQHLNSIQKIEDITLYPPDFFCPQANAASPIHLTENTLSIHHFSATWLPWHTRLRLKFQRMLPKSFVNMLRRIS